MQIDGSFKAIKDGHWTMNVNFAIANDYKQGKNLSTD